MTDQQQSAFRFRVPRLRSVLPPRTTTTQTPARKPPVRPLPQPLTPPSVRPQGTSPAPPSASPLPAQAPRPQEPPAPTPRPQEPPAPRPQEPSATTQESPGSPQTPRQQEPPAPTPRPQEPPETPQKPPASPTAPSVESLGTVQDPPLVEPSPAQREPPVQPSLPQQNEPASMPPTPIQAAPPFSPSQLRGLTKPTSPSRSIQPSSQPPEVKMSTEIDSTNNKKGTDYALNAAPNEEQTSMEVPSMHSYTESHIEENHQENQEAVSAQTKSVISHPDDKIPVPKSPQSRKLNGPQLPTPPNQHLNEKPAIITLAGDNRGTSMHIGTGETKREKSIHIYRRYKVNPDESTDAMTDEEEEEKENDSKANETEENFSYINCNIQGINNSMVFNCSITEGSPGVHFGSCDREHVKKPKRKYIKSTDMNKLNVKSTPSQKHTIRRRCLRGLFMESSDSDPNDPQKPRRHGCRYIGEDKSNKDDKMDVV